MASNGPNEIQDQVQQPNQDQDQDDDVQIVQFVQGVPPVRANPAVPAQNADGQANDEETECVVCTNTMFLPTKVPDCNHTFCFTCLKAVALSQSAGCPICRGHINLDVFRRTRDINLKMRAPGEAEPDFSVRRFLNNQGDELEEVKPDIDALRAQLNAEAARVFWVYSGRNHGHWRFEPRTELEIEEAYNSGLHQEITVIIMGRNYKVDFVNMLQYPETQPQYARPIRRLTAQEFDQLTNENLINGIAGAPAQLI